MPNLNLTHSGNMNITSASITSGGTLEVAYGKNETGAITGWTFNSDDTFESGQTYTVYCYPKTSGIVQSESFIVSGIDNEGVPRSDTSILRQGYDSDFRNYMEELGERLVQMSPDTPRDVPMQKFRIDATDPGTAGYYFIMLSETPNDQSASAFPYSIAPDENLIIDNYDYKNIDSDGVWVSGNVYDYTFSRELYFSRGEENTPFNQVWYFAETGGLDATGLTINSSATTENYVSITFTVTGDIGDTLAFRIPTVSGSVDAIFTSTITGEEPEPVPGTMEHLYIVVDNIIVDSGQASYSYTYTGDIPPIMDLDYSSSNPEYATIDPVTGEITVIADGTTTLCVHDSISDMYGCSNVTVSKTPEPPGPDTGSAITSLTISVADEIVGSGVVVPIYAPSDVPVSLVYSSTDTSKATIDQNGNVTVLGDGTVTLCVEDEISGLIACKEVSVRIPVYIDSIEIIVDNIFLVGQATAVYDPTGATVSLVYSSSDPSIATINQSTGEIMGYRDGQVTFCVRDLYTNKTDCKTVSIIHTPKVCVTYNTNDPDLGGGSTGNTFIFLGKQYTPGDPDFYVRAEYNGVDITNDIIGGTAQNSGYYQFPEGGYQTICYSLRVTERNGVYHCGIPKMTFTTPSFGSNVVAVTFEEASPSLNAQIGLAAFSGATDMYNEVVIPNGWSLAEYLSDSTVSLGGQFHACRNLRSVVLGNGVTDIGPGTFSVCTNLTSVTMTNSVQNIEQSAFYGTGIKEITIPNSVTRIGSNAFATSLLTGVTIPSSVSTLGENIFSGCTSLQYVNYPNNRVFIPEGMCRDCTSLTGFTFSSNITRVDANAFRGCSGLQQLVFTSTNPPTLGNASVFGSSCPIYVPCGSYWDYRTANVWKDNYTSRLAVESGCSTAITIDAVYHVTSTTVATKITNDSRFSSTISKIFLDDGTVIPMNTSNVYGATTYLFSKTGNTNVHFELKVTNMNAVTYYFQSLPDLISIEYPLPVTNISAPPFNCDALTAITYPSTLVSIGNTSTSYPPITGQSLKRIKCYATTAPTLVYYSGGSAVGPLAYGGTLYYPNGSNYSSWLNKLPGSWNGSPTL